MTSEARLTEARLTKPRMLRQSLSNSTRIPLPRKAIPTVLAYCRRQKIQARKTGDGIEAPISDRLVSYCRGVMQVAK